MEIRSGKSPELDCSEMVRVVLTRSHIEQLEIGRSGYVSIGYMSLAIAGCMCYMETYICLLCGRQEQKTARQVADLVWSLWLFWFVDPGSISAMYSI